MYVAYPTGAVNVHQVGDWSFDFICQVQREFTSGIFQKMQLLPDNRLLVLSSPSQVSLKKVEASGKHCETLRTFNAAYSIYDFCMHPSGEYLLVLTELGRVFIYSFASAEYRGYIEV